MLKRSITYTDFNDEEVTETFYFNITKSELVDLEVGHEDGLENFVMRIVKTEDKKALIGEFKRIILLSYGERSADGKRFVKNQELRDAFEQSAAYDALFIELLSSEDALVAFIQGVLPKDLVAGMDTSANPPATQTVELPDSPPSPFPKPSPGPAQSSHDHETGYTA